MAADLMHATNAVSTPVRLWHESCIAGVRILQNYGNHCPSLCASSEHGIEHGKGEEVRASSSLCSLQEPGCPPCT